MDAVANVLLNDVGLLNVKAQTPPLAGCTPNDIHFPVSESAIISDMLLMPIARATVTTAVNVNGAAGYAFKIPSNRLDAEVVSVSTMP